MACPGPFSSWRNYPEQSLAIQGLREGLQEVNAGINRLFLAILGIGAAQVGLLATLIARVG